VISKFDTPMYLSLQHSHIFLENLCFCHINWWTWPGCVGPLAASFVFFYMFCDSLVLLKLETRKHECMCMGSVHVHGLPMRTLLDMISVRGRYTWYLLICPECRVVPIIALCDLIIPHECHCIYVEAWTEMLISWTSVFQDLTGKQTIIVSGHHGKLHIDGLRFIIDEGGGYEDKPIAAIVFPSKTLIRSTDVAHWTQRHSFFPCNYCL